MFETLILRVGGKRFGREIRQGDDEGILGGWRCSMVAKVREERKV